MDYHFSLYRGVARGKLMTLFLLFTYTKITLLLLAPSITQGAGYSGILKSYFPRFTFSSADCLHFLPRLTYFSAFKCLFEDI